MSQQTAFRPVMDLLEASAADLRRRISECPSELSVSTKLYTTQQIMLSAIRENCMTAALVEICSNLLGCEQMAIVKIDNETRTLDFIHQVGLSPEQHEALIQNGALLHSRLVPGVAEIPSKEREEDASLLALGINAVVPLWADERSRGAMVLFELLPQQFEFDEEAREVLRLLSIYAGPCIRSQNVG